MATSILMVLTNLVRVALGLYRSVNEESDMFDIELKEIRDRIEGASSESAPSAAPSPGVVPSDKVSRIEFEQLNTRFGRLEERMRLLEELNPCS